MSIAELEIAQQVANVVKEHKEWPPRPDRNRLIPKKGVVVDANPPFSKELNLSPNEEFILSGDGFLPIDDFLGRRTVFLEKPIVVNGQQYFLEVKGYGRNGQELYPELHEEGDLYFGMFLDTAGKEFYIPSFAEAIGIMDVQKAVALLKFHEDEFLKHSLNGFEELLVVRSRGWLDEKYIAGVRKLLDLSDSFTDKAFDEEKARKEMAKESVDLFNTAYSQDGIEGVRNLAEFSGFSEDFAGLLSGKEFGYAIRAVRSPLRVGDLNDPEIDTPKNRLTSEKAGEIVRILLLHGYLNMSPNPGNFTTAGELVDFEEFVKIPNELTIIEKEMARLGIKSLDEYIEYIFGKGTLGHLAPSFIKGFLGKPGSIQDVIVKASQAISAKI